MYATPAAALLEAWEQGQTQHPLQRALTILRVADPQMPLGQLADLPVSERDRRLIALRDRWIGPRFDAVARCPECRESLEFSFSSYELPAAPERAPVVERWVWQGQSFEPRLPTTADLVAAAESPAADRIGVLASRCAGAPLGPDGHEPLAAHLAESDPLLDFQIALECPACRHSWHTLFDIAQYFWQEIAEQGQRLLREVHLLAQAYGWTETEILALSARRRRAYLDLVMGA